MVDKLSVVTRSTTRFPSNDPSSSSGSRSAHKVPVRKLLTEPKAAVGLDAGGGSANPYSMACASPLFSRLTGTGYGPCLRTSTVSLPYGPPSTRVSVQLPL